MDGVDIQVIFSSICSVAGRDSERSRKTLLINTWLRDWCNLKNFGFVFFFDCEAVYSAPGLMSPNGFHQSQREKQILAQELTGLIERALNSV